MKRWMQWLFAAWMLLAAAAAQAITCTSITSPGFATTYYNRTNVMTQATFTVTCSRGNQDPEDSVTYDVQVDNGSNPQQQNNRASLGNDTVKYELYTDSTCTTPWTGTTKITDTITWQGNKKGNASRQSSFWVCIPSQNVTGSGGNFTDTVTMTLSYAGGTSITGTIPVEIFAPANCSFTTSPGAINLSYAAFGPAQSGSTSFAVQCTSGMPYTISTNVPEGVLVNLRYVLSLSNTSGTGTGTPQSFSVTATIPAGQGGSCTAGNCTASQSHTVVISY